MLTGLLTMAYSDLFPYATRINLLKVGTAHSGLDPFTSSTNQENTPTDLCTGKPNRGILSSEVPFFPTDPSFWQADKKVASKGWYKGAVCTLSLAHTALNTSLPLKQSGIDS